MPVSRWAAALEHSRLIKGRWAGWNVATVWFFDQSFVDGTGWRVAARIQEGECEQELQGPNAGGQEPQSPTHRCSSSEVSCVYCTDKSNLLCATEMDWNVSASRRSLFLKDEAMDPKGREPQTATVKPAAPQRDVTGNDEEHLFDLEWPSTVETSRT